VVAVPTLSFLGLGIQPPPLCWGLAIANSYTLIAAGHRWTMISKAVAVMSLVVTVRLVAEGLSRSGSSPH